MDILSKSLEQYIKIYKKFSLKTALQVTEQILTRIEQIHNYGFIHRDIKPENLMFGVDTESTTLYMIDFGLAKPYRNR
jgi:serine/threonine protein kinase